MTRRVFHSGRIRWIGAFALLSLLALALLPGIFLPAVAAPVPRPMAPAQSQPDEATVRAETFLAAQGVIVSAAEDGLSNMALQIADAKNPRSPIARERAQAINHIRQIRHQVELAFNGDAPDKDRVLRDLIAQERDEEQSLSQINARMDREGSAFAELSRPRPLQFSEVQGLLGQDEALLVIVPAPDATYLWAVTRDRFEWARAEMTDAQLDEAVHTLRDHLDIGGKGGAIRPFRRAVAHTLYQKLIAPLEGAFRSKRVLLTATAGALQSLPLAVLVTDSPAGSDEDLNAVAETHWLADRYALETLPAVSSLRALRCYARGKQTSRPTICSGQPSTPSAVQGASTQQDTFVGFGDPLVHGEGSEMQGPASAKAYSKGEVADVRALDGLARLKRTAQVVTSVAGEFDPTARVVRVGPEMTEGAFKSDPHIGKAEFILIATHGLLSTESGEIGDPGLVFTPPPATTSYENLLNDDGLLTASEVASLDLSAQFVVLSACNTARNDGTLGSDGLSGLARAFFFAGAHSLLVSHWPIDAAASETLVIGTFRAYRRQAVPPAILPAGGSARDPVSRAQALQAGIYAVRHSPEHPEWALPIFWGGFVLVGD